MHLNPVLHKLRLFLSLVILQLLSSLDLFLKFPQVSLCHLLCMVGVVGEQQQLFKVVLLAFQTLLNGCQLVVVAHPLILQSLHYHFVCLSDALSLVVLDHGFVQFVLQHSDHSHLRIVF